jgi:hypothetical protein
MLKNGRTLGLTEHGGHRRVRGGVRSANVRPIRMQGAQTVIRDNSR